MEKLIILVCVIVSASALSCLPCSEIQCKKPKCRYTALPELCGCCPVCVAFKGDFCSESVPCYRGLTCYKVEYMAILPWFYKGICVNEKTLSQLPPTPDYQA